MHIAGRLRPGERAFTNIGRVCGARAGAVVTMCLAIDYWREDYLKVLSMRIDADGFPKLSGYQQYHSLALKHPLIIAAIRAKAIMSSLVYVPALDAFQQAERSGDASVLCEEVCAHVYG